jgi:hypothetical protein
MRKLQEINTPTYKKIAKLFKIFAAVGVVGLIFILIYLESVFPTLHIRTFSILYIGIVSIGIYETILYLMGFISIHEL